MKKNGSACLSPDIAFIAKEIHQPKAHDDKPENQKNVMDLHAYLLVKKAVNGCAGLKLSAACLFVPRA